MPQIIKIKGERRKPLPPRTFMGFQLDKNDLYNGKPLEHWLAMADENVMSAIVRGINEDKNSLVATITAERLKAIAMALNPSLYYKIREERDRCRNAIPGLIGNMLGWHDPNAPHPPQNFCAKHMPKHMMKSKKVKKSRKCK